MATDATSQVRARYVQVAVNAGRPTHMTFSYRVPPGREVEAGDVVHVPFGKRTLQGIVVDGPTGFSGYHGDIRDLDPPVEGAPRLGAFQLALARWIAHEYLAPQWEAPRADAASRRGRAPARARRARARPIRRRRSPSDSSSSTSCWTRRRATLPGCARHCRGASRHRASRPP